MEGAGITRLSLRKLETRGDLKSSVDDGRDFQISVVSFRNKKGHFGVVKQYVQSEVTLTLTLAQSFSNYISFH